MYYVKNKEMSLGQKSLEPPEWVQWTHHPRGTSHCEDCLKRNGCWFLKSKAPIHPHHPYCHCTLDPIDYAVVLTNAMAYSDYGKFDPYLFNTNGMYSHKKENLFKQWGYTVEDSPWLKSEIERQARQNYLSGDYTLGKLDKRGQRLNIRITIPRKNKTESVSFVTGWMVMPNGKLKLNTPYGGK